MSGPSFWTPRQRIILLLQKQSGTNIKYSFRFAKESHFLQRIKLLLAYDFDFHPETCFKLPAGGLVDKFELEFFAGVLRQIDLDRQPSVFGCVWADCSFEELFAVGSNDQVPVTFGMMTYQEIQLWFFAFSGPNSLNTASKELEPSLFTIKYLVNCSKQSLTQIV